MAKKPGRKKTSSSTTDPVTAYAEAVVSGEKIAGPDVYNACVRHLDDLEFGPERGLKWDAAEGGHVIRFFREKLRVDRTAADKGEGTKPFELIDWQAFIVGSLFGWKAEDGTRRFRMAFIETGKGPLALDTPIATPTGWTTMGKVQVGDEVYTPDGDATTVTAVSPIFYDRECFRLTFDDGETIIADAEHRWVTEQRCFSAGDVGGAAPRRGVPKAEWGNWRRARRTTTEIAASLRYKNGKYQSANHSISLAAPLQGEEKTLPVPPYVLGVWLGDGDSDCARITCAFADGQIIDEIRSEGVPVCERTRHSTTTGRYVLSDGDRTQTARNGSTQSALRNLGLLGNKHIPSEYLRASVEQRIDLLQGLMDSDGYVGKKGACEIVLSNECLAQNCRELLATLGFKAGWSEDRARLAGRDCGPRYRIRFDPPHTFPACRLLRKIDRLKQRHSRRRLAADRRIVGCDPVASVPVRCITVADDGHMFLAGRTMVPTCNSGKSPLAAGIGLYCLTADGESRAEIYAAATKKDQAKVLFRDAVAMVETSPDLDERLHMSGGVEKTNIAYLRKGSFFRPISTEDRGRGQSGPRPHCALLDEIHEHPTNAMVEFMRAGTKGRRQALIFMITNSGSDRESVCYDYHDYGVKVCAGDIEDDSFFAFICSLDDEDDPFHDPSCWPKANPSLGITFQPKYLEEQVRQALGMPSKQNLVLRLNFCRWTDAQSAWIDRDAWLACEAALPDDVLAKRPCYLGIDLSSKRDLTALARAYPLPDGSVDAVVEFWSPGDTLKERADTDRVPYLTWRDQGHLNAPKGKTIDYGHIARRIVELDEHSEILGIAYDRWRIDDLLRELDDAGVESWKSAGLELQKGETGQGIRLVPFGQGFRDMGPAVDDLEDVVLPPDEPEETQRFLRVRVNPVLRWNVASAVLDEDAAGNRKFTKRKATGRIDGLVALTMAVRLAVQNLPVETPRPQAVWL